MRTDHDCLRWILNIEGSRSRRTERWRLRSSELDSDVSYNPGMTHYLADRISRLESAARDEKAIDDAVPVFSMRPKLVRGLDAANYVCGPTVRGINRDTVLSTQAADGYCQEVAKNPTTEGHIPFFEDPNGVLCLRSAHDGAHQVVIPASFQEQFLHLEHDAKRAGHLREFPMCAAMRRYYYSVGIAADVVAYVKKCESYARQRLRPLARRLPLTLFFATMFSRHIAVDIYGPFDRLAAVHLSILVITNRFAKLLRQGIRGGAIARRKVVYRELLFQGEVAQRRLVGAERLAIRAK